MHVVDVKVLSFIRTGSHEKVVNESEWAKAYERLTECGEFTKVWFKENMQKCYKEGSCNFNAIGGVFEYLGYAKYCADRPVRYKRLRSGDLRR